jgi:hypothetical protein
MFVHMLGILVMTVAAFGAAFRAHIGSRRPDFPKPGVSSYLTGSGMVLVGAGLLAFARPAWKILFGVGAWEYAIGALLAFHKIRQKRK